MRGQETDLVEIPANWYLDDLPPMMFVKASPNSHGFVSPRDLEEMWRDQFDWVYRESDYAVFTMTIHPDVSGRPQALLMLERLIEYINGHEGVALGDLRRDRRRLQGPLTPLAPRVRPCRSGDERMREPPHLFLRKGISMTTTSSGIPESGTRPSRASGCGRRARPR